MTSSRVLSSSFLFPTTKYIPANNILYVVYKYIWMLTSMTIAIITSIALNLCTLTLCEHKICSKMFNQPLHIPRLFHKCWKNLIYPFHSLILASLVTEFFFLSQLPLWCHFGKPLQLLCNVIIAVKLPDLMSIFIQMTVLLFDFRRSQRTLSI